MGCVFVRYHFQAHKNLHGHMPGEPQGKGSLVGCRLWGRTESDTTDAT